MPGEQRVEEQDDEHGHRRRHTDADRLQAHLVQSAHQPRGVRHAAPVPEDLTHGPEPPYRGAHEVALYGLLSAHLSALRAGRLRRRSGERARCIGARRRLHHGRDGVRGDGRSVFG